MKAEKIYEIPVNDAFDKASECALCALTRDLENKNVEFCIGPAMMKPEFRIETNKKGFCRRHLSKMLSFQNKLPLALVLDTHMNEVRETAFRKSSIKKSVNAESTLKYIEGLKGSCAVCERIDEVFEKYINVILYMWKENEEFREKFRMSKGFCLMHFADLLQASSKLSKKDAVKFKEELTELEEKELLRINEDINWFTKKFDYKNADADWKNSKDAPFRTCEKLWGYID